MAEPYHDSLAEIRALAQLDANELDTIDGFLAALFARPAWHAEAACRDAPQALFFPSRGEVTTTAKAICERCPVADECLAYATSLDGPVLGIWGGLSTQDRRRYLRSRDRDAA